MEAYQGKGFWVCVYGEKKKRGGGGVRKELVLMCARIKHGKSVCKNQAWKECVQESNMERVLCVASTCSKASGFLVQLVVPPKSTVGFVPNLNQF